MDDEGPTKSFPDHLAQALAAGRTAWPPVDLEPDQLAPYLAARFPEGDPGTALDNLALADLYLACACLRGDERAIAALEAAHFPMVEAAVARLGGSPAQIDEVKQRLREQLFVGSGGQPALLRYRGAGPLGGWVRVIAVRTALRLLRGDKKDVLSSPDLFEALPAPCSDPELEHLKLRYRREFKESFEAAVKCLSRRERNLLRCHHVDGLTIDEVGQLYRVHRATAARWIARARETVLAGTRRALQARLKLGRGEFESIMRLIQSQLHISLSAILPPFDLTASD
jgi:RNA polymerase sigma-70 factor, ECF subfamily